MAPAAQADEIPVMNRKTNIKVPPQTHYLVLYISLIFVSSFLMDMEYLKNLIVKMLKQSPNILIACAGIFSKVYC